MPRHVISRAFLANHHHAPAALLRGCQSFAQLNSITTPRRDLTLDKTSSRSFTMAAHQRIAIVSVYDKTGLLDLAKGLVQNNVRLLASGGTSKMIRDSGFPVE